MPMISPPFRPVPAALLLAGAIILTFIQTAVAQIPASLAFARISVGGTVLEGYKQIPELGGVDLKDYLQLRSFEYEILKPSVSGDLKAGALRITKFIDRSTPLLAQALASSSDVSVEIVIFGVDPSSGATVRTATWKLTNARVIADRVWLPEAGITATGQPAEEVQFSYAELEIEHASGSVSVIRAE